MYCIRWLTYSALRPIAVVVCRWCKQLRVAHVFYTTGTLERVAVVVYTGSVCLAHVKIFTLRAFRSSYQADMNGALTIVNWWYKCFLY